MKKMLLGMLIILMGGANVFAMTFDEAKGQGKPIVVMFKMQGCSACKQFEPIFDKASNEFADKFNFVKDDVYSSNLSDKFNVHSVPALFVVEPKTNKSKKVDDSDMYSEARFKKFLKNY